MGVYLQEEEEMSRSSSSRREKDDLVPPFLTKTYELVDDPKTDAIVSWGESNESFVVWRAPEFARDLLPNYFKHNNFSSFVRQLNTYGFRKIVTERWEFANDLFRKGEKHLLSDIHRRCKSSSDAGGLVSSPTPPSSSSSSFISNNLCPASSIEAIAISLCHENERLRTNNSLLLREITRLHKLYTDAISFVHQNHTNRHILLPSHYNCQLSSSPDHYKGTNNNHNNSGQIFLPCLQSSASASPLSIKETQLQLAGPGKSHTAHHRSVSSMIDERDYDEEDTTIKIFGVPLHASKRLRLSVSTANS